MTEIQLSIAFQDAAKLRQKKQLDYGGIREYFPFGAKSYCHEINKKVTRLINLIKDGKKPANESIEDNLLDLINYASYYYEWQKGVLDE